MGTAILLCATVTLERLAIRASASEAAFRMPDASASNTPAVSIATVELSERMGVADELEVVITFEGITADESDVMAVDIDAADMMTRGNVDSFIEVVVGGLSVEASVDLVVDAEDVVGEAELSGRGNVGATIVYPGVVFSACVTVSPFWMMYVP